MKLSVFPIVILILMTISTKIFCSTYSTFLKRLNSKSSVRIVDFENVLFKINTRSLNRSLKKIKKLGLQQNLNDLFISRMKIKQDIAYLCEQMDGNQKKCIDRRFSTIKKEFEEINLYKVIEVTKKSFLHNVYLGLKIWHLSMSVKFFIPEYEKLKNMKSKRALIKLSKRIELLTRLYRKKLNKNDDYEDLRKLYGFYKTNSK